ncbi:ATP-binding cassette domain-containing protein [Klugiella xanthotipulae]|uniref:ABC-2 type transport system ATP-binding protein n=1 Tax=Klugiella xanthotipulae TaxID=244735 RepID=A0A543I750_9MICO|nr:ATP-binding cassette domain-containing protein [Klugiella xanthotipulae]TQM66408.1 ABC-2 type transport system ATP-binding protein [Klugiella xanthotipulae]
MADGLPIEFHGVTKRFGGVTAVDDVTATVLPGRVTGFLGPNGAGKTTTLRILLGLVGATTGTATIGGTPYRSLSTPLHTVGAALEAASFHPGRSGRNHLDVYARAARLPNARIGVVLDQVGLTDAADRRVGGYSLGMRQRLGLAYALLGDPAVVVLDEPINGLDPEGIRWIRTFLRELASEGRTVLISSHMLGEVQQTVDEALIIRRGSLVYSGSLSELEARSASWVIVDGPDRPALAAALTAAGFTFNAGRQGTIVNGGDTAAVGHAAFVAGVELHSLHRHATTLEDTFLSLINDGGLS